VIKFSVSGSDEDRDELPPRPCAPTPGAARPVIIIPSARVERPVYDRAYLIALEASHDARYAAMAKRQEAAEEVRRKGREQRQARVVEKERLARLVEEERRAREEEERRAREEEERRARVEAEAELELDKFLADCERREREAAVEAERDRLRRERVAERVAKQFASTRALLAEIGVAITEPDRLRQAQMDEEWEAEAEQVQHEVLLLGKRKVWQLQAEGERAAWDCGESSRKRVHGEWLDRREEPSELKRAWQAVQDKAQARAGKLGVPWAGNRVHWGVAQTGTIPARSGIPTRAGTVMAV